MKTKNLLIALATIFFIESHAQCPLSFDNQLGCQGTIDITWRFENCNAVPCGTGGSQAGMPFGTTIVIPCDALCVLPVACNIFITVTAVNGCAITPTTVDWLTAFSSPGGKYFVTLPCPGTGCGNCCDGGNSIGIDTSGGGFGWVN